MTTAVGSRQDGRSGIKMTGQEIMYRSMYAVEGYGVAVQDVAGESPPDFISTLVVGLSLGLVFAIVGGIFTLALRT